ncbi:MAG: lysophospholipid acyltransferase family protein [Gemmatimonadales bacterium]
MAGLRMRFPYGAPTWPGSVERPPARSRTGVDFETAWARRTPARVARRLLLDFVVRPAVHAVATPDVDGRERLDHVEAPAIFAANHHSHLDTGLLLSVLPERFRRRTVVAAAADYFFTSRAKGAVNALVIGAVPVERLKVNRRSSDASAELLEDGWSLLIFPEGGRSPDGWGQDFRGGAAYLSLRTGRPIVPVFLSGTGRVWPKGQRLPRPAKVSVTFGSPLLPTEGESARRLAARLEAVVSALGDEVATDWWSARRRAAAATTPSLTGPAAVAWRRAWALGERRQ